MFVIFQLLLCYRYLFYQQSLISLSWMRIGRMLFFYIVSLLLVWLFGYVSCVFRISVFSSWQEGLFIFCFSFTFSVSIRFLFRGFNLSIFWYNLVRYDLFFCVYSVLKSHAKKILWLIISCFISSELGILLTFLAVMYIWYKKLSMWVNSFWIPVLW